MATGLNPSTPPPDLSWRTKGVANLTVHVSSSVKPTSGPGSVSTSPALWRTPEFLLYALVFLCCLPLMTYSVLNLSQSMSGSCITRNKYSKPAQWLQPPVQTTLYIGTDSLTGGFSDVKW